MQRIWQKAFLAGLTRSGSVTQAAKTAHVSRFTVYEHKRNDPGFAAAWEQALDAGADALEDEARKRAFDGSDVLLMFLLKGLRPQRWRESRATIPPAELNRMIEAELARIAKQKEAEAVEPVN